MFVCVCVYMYVCFKCLNMCVFGCICIYIYEYSFMDVTSFSSSLSTDWGQVWSWQFVPSPWAGPSSHGIPGLLCAAVVFFSWAPLGVLYQSLIFISGLAVQSPTGRYVFRSKPPFGVSPVPFSYYLTITCPVLT